MCQVQQYHARYVFFSCRAETPHPTTIFFFVRTCGGYRDVSFALLVVIVRVAPSVYEASRSFKISVFFFFK